LLYDDAGPSFTYHCDGNGHSSVIDYFICSPKLCNINTTPVILHDGDNMSDHCAIYVTLTTPDARTSVGKSSHHPAKLLWNKADS